MSDDKFDFTLAGQPHYDFRVERATVGYKTAISCDRENTTDFGGVLKSAVKSLFLQARYVPSRLQRGLRCSINNTTIAMWSM